MSGDEPEPRFRDLTITRRDALRGALAGGVLLGTGGVMAACGSEAVDVPTRDFGATSLKDVRRGGTLRVGVAGGGADDSIDAHVLATVPDISRAFQLYEPLAGRDTHSDFELVLAESIEPDKKAQAWTIRLRPGVTFHNGKPVTADDVLFSLRRIIDPKDPKTGAASIGYVDIDRSRKLDSRTVRIQLKFPNVGFPDDVGQYFNSIVPTD
jgi:peptide/nickel transport system substrate-binding protein